MLKDFSLFQQAFLQNSYKKESPLLCSRLVVVCCDSLLEDLNKTAAPVEGAAKVFRSCVDG